MQLRLIYTTNDDITLLLLKEKNTHPGCIIHIKRPAVYDDNKMTQLDRDTHSIFKGFSKGINNNSCGHLARGQIFLFLLI